MAELILKEEVYAVAGAALDVYYTMGRGFLEPVYQEALAIELTRRSIPFEREKELSIHYKDVKLDPKYYADFVCFDEIVVELKVIPRLGNIEYAQIINYMKITRHRVGMLMNFGSSPKLEWKRFVV